MAGPEFKYDVFLSHNGKDKPAVERIARPGYVQGDIKDTQEKASETLVITARSRRRTKPRKR